MNVTWLIALLIFIAVVVGGALRAWRALKRSERMLDDVDKSKLNPNAWDDDD